MLRGSRGQARGPRGPTASSTASSGSSPGRAAEPAASYQAARALRRARAQLLPQLRRRAPQRTQSCDTCETARRALRERGAAPCRARGRTSSATWRSGCSSRRARASRTPRRPRRRVPSQLVGKRKLVGFLRGYDQFMNLVVEDAIELVSLTEKNEIGTVVIRGARAASHRLRRPVAHASHRRQLRREARCCRRWQYRSDKVGRRHVVHWHLHHGTIPHWDWLHRHQWLQEVGFEQVGTMLCSDIAGCGSSGISGSGGSYGLL